MIDLVRENPNLVGVYPTLTSEEKELIIRAVQHRRMITGKTYKNRYHDVTPGTLPFLNSDDAQWCLRNYRGVEGSHDQDKQIMDLCRRIDLCKLPKLRNSNAI